MKKIFQFALLLLLSGTGVLGQTTVVFPDGKIVNEAFVIKYVDSVFAARPSTALPPVIKSPVVINPPVAVVPPVVVPVVVPGLKPCKGGPTIWAIQSITDNSLVFVFDGDEVNGIDWRIAQNGATLRSGNVEPKTNTIPVTYQTLPGGTYTLHLSGSTCLGISPPRDFTIEKWSGQVNPPKVIPVPDYSGDRNDGPARLGVGQREIFMNLTGGGWDANSASGMESDWTERIESFKYSWGWGITGIRVAVRWYQYEPKSGVYRDDVVQKMIEYCRARGLKLSFFVWPFRLPNDGFIPDGHYMTGDLGGRFEIEPNPDAGLPGNPMPSMASDISWRKFDTAMGRLSKKLSEYEGAYYIGLGLAEAEEIINPMLNTGSSRQELTGFEQIYQDDFARWLRLKGKTYSRPQVQHWGSERYGRGGSGLVMNDAGKEFFKYVSLRIANAFDGFSKVVWENGGGKVRPCYMYADVANATGHHLASNWITQARGLYGRGGVMYSTEGGTPELKMVGNAINLGIAVQKSPDIVSAVEYDPDDLGQKGGYGSSIDLGLMDRAFRKSLDEGVDLISFAMSFHPQNNIPGMGPILERIFRDYMGKPYPRPATPPIVTVNVNDLYFNYQSLESRYGPYNGKAMNWFRFDDASFFGSQPSLY